MENLDGIKIRKSVLGNMIIRQTMGGSRKEDRIRCKDELMERIRKEYIRQNSYKTHRLDLTMLDVSKVDDMNNLFSACYICNLETVDVSNWDTGNVRNMYGMFYNFDKLKCIDVSKWNVDNVENMDSMFFGCISLENIDVSKWNTGNIKYMGFLFSGCSSLESVDVSDWDVCNAEDMKYMFYGCKSLGHVDVSKWDVSNAEDIYGMFYGCKFDYKKEKNGLVSI